MRTESATQALLDFEPDSSLSDTATGLPGLATQRILIVDDQEDLHRALWVRFQSEGFEVVSAFDGVDAYAKLTTTEPDLVILDLQLPRMHGFKLLHQARMSGAAPGAPVIVITGDPDPTIEERARRWGVARVYRKPVAHVELVQAARELLLS